MKLQVLLPHQVFAEIADVSRIVAEGTDGSFGLLPNRLDCVAALVPGILVCESASQGELCFAIDEGVLVKTGPDVRVAVRRALTGPDLTQLHDAVAREFLSRSEHDQDQRDAMARLETGLLRELVRFQHG